MANWTLLARDTNREIMGVLEGWALDLTLRLNEVGSWSITVPRETIPAPGDWPRQFSGLVMLRDGVPVASGQVESTTFEWSASPDDDAAGPGNYSISGATDMLSLGWRIVYPNPDGVWSYGGQEGTPYYVRPGNDETLPAGELMRQIVNEQAGSLARSERRVPGLRIGQPLDIGAQVKVRDRFSNLLDLLREVALAGGNLVFDVVDALDSNFDFVVREPTDRTLTARFGPELGNVTSLKMQYAAPTVTAALVAAGGELDSRYLQEFPDELAGQGRRFEALVDQRQVGSADSNNEVTPEQEEELVKKAEEVLAEGAAQTAVSARILDTPHVQWLRDYNIGDLVSIQTPLGAVTDFVREVRVKVDETGYEQIETTIGTEEATQEDPMARVVKRMQRRLYQLEKGL